MKILRNNLSICAVLLLLQALAHATPSFPPLKDDSVSRIRSDLKAVGREYLAVDKPSSSRMTTMYYKFDLLEKRCIRVGGAADPDLEAMLGLIRRFKLIVKQRSRQEAERRKNEVKPYVFNSISGPTMREGGHSDKGLTYLVYEVKQFAKHWRGLKHTKYTGYDVYLTGSRHYFERDIESSIRTAEHLIEDAKRFKDPKKNNLIIVRSRSPGTISFNDYTPKQNLRWALGVARVARYFESQVGGSVDQWVAWERKVQAAAARHRISLD